MNESLNNEDNEEESMICTDFKYMFNEKFVVIDRPFDHPKRGFGFLLNSGLANRTHNCLKKLQDQNINQILEQNYAQIMVVENGKGFQLLLEFILCRCSTHLFRT